MDLNILVSINCITYNHEKYISDAIDSFLMQKTNFNFEILIGEDCSTDGTRKIVEDYARKFPEKIKLITSENNVGWRKNEQRVFENSKGKYIALCEGDDYWIDPYKLQKQVDYMENHPECSMCFHAAKIVNENKKIKGTMRPYKASQLSLVEDIISGGGGFCPTASLLIPKTIMENLPEFCQNAFVTDYPLQMWCASQGYAYYIDEMMAVYRTGVRGSWTSNLYSGTNVVEKVIDSKENEIKLLDKFNMNTNYDYSSVINETKINRQFEILLLQNRIKEIKFSKEYKIYYDKLNNIEKIKIYIKLYLPNFYKILGKVKKELFY
ncbi:glycosyltransferase [Heyndrickxia oleronia]|jgi:glycosyltransferase involved in cell wall biosynthesis|uniref:glycosyltransferase n=1 Tax=Heyndrickxia oleronia TaxID=38875 RepID=UPI0024327355|nr:glycosyltransferase [Heyndrickxia oleronia]MCI1590684.1 glycosyltransferase [Heyndrickxia oleronia]MCI1612127.1 glycosyltransferase [Heyndrickxia oleronia]MCI1759836.1 glycosyltransferase [Heyndrickxia oleronia]